MRRILVVCGLATLAVLSGGVTPAPASAVDLVICEVSVRDRTPGVYPGGFYVYQDCIPPIYPS